MKKLIKVEQYNKELKNGTIMTFIRCELFNPFAKRNPNEIIPKFELIPRIGIGIRRDFIKGNFEGFYLIIGWLNFYIEFFINWFRKIKNI